MLAQQKVTKCFKIIPVRFEISKHLTRFCLSDIISPMKTAAVKATKSITKTTKIFLQLISHAAGNKTPKHTLKKTEREKESPKLEIKHAVVQSSHYAYLCTEYIIRSCTRILFVMIQYCILYFGLYN